MSGDSQDLLPANRAMPLDMGLESTMDTGSGVV